jgi:hypothetical protein
MGVPMCDRGNCTNVSPNRFSFNFGYICDRCFNELLNSNMTISDFMDTNPGDNIIGDGYSECNEEFQLR